MGLQPVEKTIDGEVYEFAYLPPRISLALLSKIIKLVGPALGVLANKKDNEVKVKVKEEDEDSESKIDDLDIGAATKMLCDRLDENETQFIIDTLLSQVTHHGLGNAKRAYDAIFTGRLRHLFSVVKSALEVQYADFFGEKNVLEELKEIAVKGSTLA